MFSITDKIKRRVRAHGYGRRVFTPKDFLDFGSRVSIDQALSRLVKSGFLRRIARGLYDSPRIIPALKRQAPPNIDAAIAALKRRDNVHIIPDGIVAANSLGLTNAIPAKAIYITDGATRTLKIGNRTIHLRRASQCLRKWFDRPGAPVIQALYWLGQRVASNPEVINILRLRLTANVKQDIIQGIKLLPSWMASIINQAFTKDGSVAV